MKYTKPILYKIDMKIRETAGAGCKTDETGDGPDHAYACWKGDWTGLCASTQS